MGDKEDYLTSYRVFFENFAATVNPEDQLPVNIAGYTITESELPGEVLYWITQYLTEKQCPLTLMTPLRRIILNEVQIASKKYPNEYGYKSDDSVYIALRLMQAVTARVNDVCLRYLDNSRLDSLPPPPPLAQRDLKTVSCATKNSRRVMEDRHVEVGNLEALFDIDTTEPTSFYAVYDGHAGSAAATYCAAHLHQYLVESPHFTTDLRKAMRDAFLRTDAEFIRKSNQERACGGSTAVVVAVRGRKLLAAWAGDSLALLAKRMRLMQLVRPHKPSREDERDRIEASGGSVMYWGTWRVNGQLAVSRAIGDAQYKPYVTARPEIATVDLDGDEDFVVVACDGLWDFVSEDDVALAVYRQLAADPDDLKAVTKRLIVQAKRQGSADNISIIVVFLKEPRDIAADNRPPMDLGLDNALANATPFAGETEACKRQAEASALTADAEADAEADADNGVDNSDSDSEDLGPETAVDADDVDADRNHEPAPPTPPAHTVDAGHVDGALVDNVAESGDESEDEWNYFKGEGEREGRPTEPDEPPRSDTPGQDNSAWESSSVDMNSSPLNPDAPVFIPGTVGASDVLLAESPRKPLPMDDIELPDVAQFETGAVVRPAELLDLDNCDQLNGHHNVSINDAVKEHLNGNDKCTMDSLGFGFNVGIEPDKVKESGFIQDFERIQKDTTDFCNIQVFQTHSETNPFAVDGDDELFERLKNKERDPMSMSFYQEKDDDTCERDSEHDRVDLNAVQPLPDSDDDEPTNGLADKENVAPGGPEPDNDILRFDERDLARLAFPDNCVAYNNHAEPGPQPALHTDTPESHKLMFEQIPEIPDGKSSELGFADERDPSDGERDALDETSHDVDMDSKNDDEPLDELQRDRSDHDEPPAAPADGAGDVPRDQDHSFNFADDLRGDLEAPITAAELAVAASPSPAPSPVPAVALSPSPLPSDAAAPVESPVTAETLVPVESSAPVESPGPIESPAPQEPPARSITPAASASPAPEIVLPSESPAPSAPIESPPPRSPLPTESPLPAEVQRDSPLPGDASLPRDSPLPSESPLPRLEEPAEPAPAASPAPAEPAASPLPSPSPPLERRIPLEADIPFEAPIEAVSEVSCFRAAPVRDEAAPSPLPADVPLPGESPAPPASPAPRALTPLESPIEAETAREPAPEAQPEPEPTREPALEAQPEPETTRELALEARPDSEPERPAEIEIERPASTEVAVAVETGEPAVSPAEEVAEEAPLAAAAPAPDLVPEPRADLVTDVDVGVAESRAQEICVPVTCEIRPEDGEQRVATPPPAPDAAPLAAAAAGAAAAGAAAAVALAAAASKPKTPASARKPTTTPAKADARATKTAPRPGAATPRTPASAKKPAPAAPAPRTPAATAPRTPASAPRAAPARTTSASKPATTAAAKPAAAAAKPAPITRAPSTKPAAPARPAPTAAATKPAAAKAPAAPPTRTTAAPRAAAPRAPISRAAAAARPAPAPAAAPRPPAASTTMRAAPRPAPARPALSAASKPKAPERKLPEKKPLMNGDVKDSRPAARPAPRAAPRAAAPAAHKAAAPRPASTRAPLDKQSKDLVNKRITAKAAPPRTAATKAAIGAKSPAKAGGKAAEAGGLTNGCAAKAPPSPPPDGALLPDVIA